MKKLHPLKIGRMAQDPFNLFPGEIWAFDNGAFRDWKNERDFDLNKFNKWLSFAQDRLPIPYLAVLPDIVGGGSQSLLFSLEWLDDLKHNGWPWYLALQDNMDVMDVIDIINMNKDSIYGLFLGGTDNYKQYAGYWSGIAHTFGLKFHYARAGTVKKVFHAKLVSADSLDTSFPLWSMDRLLSFTDTLRQNPLPGIKCLTHQPTKSDGGLVNL
jgi:hypothetical protein